MECNDTASQSDFLEMTRAIFAALTLAALIMGAAGIHKFAVPTEEQIAEAELQRMIDEAF